MADQLMLTSDRVKQELFNGGFRPMTVNDMYAYADASNGSLIAELSVGRFSYDVIFDPSVGNVQIFNCQINENFAWEMDLNTGKVIAL